MMDAAREHCPIDDALVVRSFDAALSSFSFPSVSGRKRPRADSDAANVEASPNLAAIAQAQDPVYKCYLSQLVSYDSFFTRAIAMIQADDHTRRAKGPAPMHTEEAKEDGLEAGACASSDEMCAIGEWEAVDADSDEENLALAQAALVEALCEWRQESAAGSVGRRGRAGRKRRRQDVQEGEGEGVLHSHRIGVALDASPPSPSAIAEPVEGALEGPVDADAAGHPA
jgi:hypothetical protein